MTVPDCLYCEQLLDGVTVHGLHVDCNEHLHEELAEREGSMKFSGALNWQDSEGQCGTIGRFHDVEADSPEEAERIVIEEYWDNRLDAAGCVPVIVLIQTENYTCVEEL